MATIQFTGSLLVQLTPSAKPQPIPMDFLVVYTKKSVDDYTWESPETNLAIAHPSVETPRVIYAEVTRGSLTISTSAAGAGAFTLAYNATPQPNDPPSRMLITTYSSPTVQLYISTPGATDAKIWLFG